MTKADEKRARIIQAQAEREAAIASEAPPRPKPRSNWAASTSTRQMRRGPRFPKPPDSSGTR